MYNLPVKVSTVHEKGTSGQVRPPVEQQLEDNSNYGEADLFQSDESHIPAHIHCIGILQALEWMPRPVSN
jgi:hypothetical protein